MQVMAGEETLEFHWADYLVLCAMLFASAAIGIFYAFVSRRNNSSGEFMLASRQMGFFPVAMSLLASLFTGIYIQGGVAETYYRGVILLLGSLIPLLISGTISGRIFQPKFYELKLVTVYQYLDMRFGVVVRSACLALGYLFMILHSGIATRAASIVLQTVTNSKLSLISSAVILSAVCTFYTVIGGIKAVMWADCLQMFLIFASLLAAVIQGLIDVGFQEIWRLNIEGGRFNVDFEFDPRTYATFWAVFFGGIFVWLPSLSVLQFQVQRYNTCKSQTTAHISFAVFLLGCVIVTLLCVFAGMSLYALYVNCDPLTSGSLSSADGLLPYYILDVFQRFPGIPGLLVSGLCSAALSTISSILNSIATMTGEHVIKKIWKDLPDSRYLLCTKALVLFFGGLNIATTLLVSQLGDLLPAIIGVIGITNGPVCAVFVLGFFSSRANSKGTLVGFVLGFAFGIWIFFGSLVYQVRPPNLPLSIDECPADLPTEMSTMAVNVSGMMTTMAGTTMAPIGSSPFSVIDLYRISRLWYPMICMLLVIIIGIIASLIFDVALGKPETVDPQLLWSWKKSCCCCFPSLQTEDEESFARKGHAEVSDVKVDTLDERYGPNGIDNPACDDISYTTHL